jgi:hypothetical protein
MNCINRTPPDDEQLNAALDDLADPDLIAHLEVCESCRIRLESMREMDTQLRSILYRHQCPCPQMLGEYELNLLPAEAVETVRAHVLDCPLCQAELETLREFMATPDVPEPIEAVVKQPIARPTYRPIPPASPNVLVAKPLQNVAAYASRGVAVTTASDRAAQRGINLETEPLHEVKGITIFLEVREGDGGQRFLFGQLILDEFDQWSDALVELRQRGAVVTVSAVDSSAGFRCRLTNRDPFDVTITARRGTVLLLNDVLPGR